MKRPRSRAGALLFLAAALTLCARAAEEGGEKTRYPYVKTATAAGSAEKKTSPVAVVRIDDELYRHTDDAFGNLRIFSGEKTVPFAVRTASGGNTSVMDYVPVHGEITAFRHDREQNRAYLTYTLKPEKEGKKEKECKLAKLRFDVSGRDFDKKISFRFDDGSEIAERPFFNYSGKVDLRGTEFVFPPVSTKKVEICIFPFVETETEKRVWESRGADPAGNRTLQSIVSKDIRIDGISAFSGTERTVGKKGEPVPRKDRKMLSRREKDKNEIFELDGGRLPICGFELQSDSGNYRRNVKAEYLRFDADGKSRIALGEIRYAAEPGTGRKNHSEYRPDIVRVTIHNGDDAPLREPRFVLYVPVRELVLEKPALSGDGFEIFYGGPAAPAPEYGIAKYLDKFDGDSGEVFVAGQQRDNPVYRARTDYPAVARKSVPFVIGIVALALIWMIFRMYVKGANASAPR